MVSTALTTWCGSRRTRLQKLYAAHSAVGGKKPGRRTATQQLNWSLALQLAAEFQGFSRDLHDESIDFFVVSLSAPPGVESIIQNAISQGRKLNRMNANPNSLSQDFSRLGIPLLRDIKSKYQRGAKWLQSLEKLNQLRNGIAHADHGKVLSANDGKNIILNDIRLLDASMRELARAMDKVTALALSINTGKSLPW